MQPEPQYRAPAAREKLAAAELSRAGLEADVAILALEASEGKAGAEKALAAQRSKIETAERSVSELRRAVALAERLDRQADAGEAARMRADQLTLFKFHCGDREKAMAVVLEAAATIAVAYGQYSEATLQAAIAVPAGTVVPMMSIGPEGVYGAAFGPCERLILSEFYRLAPERSDGIGRFVLPFAKPTSEMVRHKPEAIPPGIGELRIADEAIIRDIEIQVSQLNDRDTAKAAASEKEAA